HLAWLRDIEEQFRPRERPGADWLIRLAVKQERTTLAALHAVFDKDLDSALGALLDDLAVYAVRVDLRSDVPAPTLGQAIAPLILVRAATLADRLASVQSIQDEAVAHAARIA